METKKGGGFKKKLDLLSSSFMKLCRNIYRSVPVRRVTCYDHFCLFQFFSILAVSMATAAIFKKSTLKSTTLHGI
jgi:hypothetical protein